MIEPIKKSSHGGKREGSGRKTETLSVSQVKTMLRKAKKWAKKTGKDLDDVLLEIIYGSADKPASPKDQLAGLKLWKEYTIAKLQEGGEMDKNLGPAVYLPEQDKGVDLKVVGGKDG